MAEGWAQPPAQPQQPSASNAPSSSELFELLSSPSATIGVLSGASLSRIAFDAVEEVVWGGGVGGALVTHNCGDVELQEIAAFNSRAVDDGLEVEEPMLPRYAVRANAHVSAVRDILPLMDGGRVLSLSAEAAAVHDSGLGPSHFQYQPATTGSADLSCACVLDASKGGIGRRHGSTVIMGRQSNGLVALDLNSGRKLHDDVETSSGSAVIRSTNRGAVIVGHTSGEVTIRGDGRSKYRVEHTMDAYKGGITAIDVRNDLLVTCGLTTLRTGQLQIDTLVKVFDVRNTCRALHHIPFAPGPAMLCFEPRFSSMVLVGSQSGIFSLMDVTLGASSFATYQVDTEGDLLMCADFSPTGEAIVFGDGGGYIHLWAGSDFPCMHMYPQVPPPPTGLLSSISATEDESVALVPIPPPIDRCPYFSETMWSGSASVGIPPRRFSERLLAGMRMHENVGYVANPEYRRGRKPGEATRLVSKLRNLRVERTKEKAEREAMERQQKVKRRLKELGIPPLKVMYNRVDVNCELSKSSRGRMRYDEFNFSKYNKTRFAGLENDLVNSYCNALIQVLYFTPKLRSAVLKSCCEHEFCVTCELGFLFHMLHVSTAGIPCQASNMLRSLRQIREAGALGLLEGTDEYEAQRDRSLTRRIQALSRFMMEQLHKELARSEHGGAPTAIESLYAISVSTTTHCTAGNHDDLTRDSYSFQVELQYPSSSEQQGRPKFSQILKSSLAPRVSMRAWCASCQEYQPIWQQRRPISLPSILVINTNIRKPREEMRWWEPLKQADTAKPKDVGSRWEGPSWLPLKIGIDIDANSGVEVFEGDDIPRGAIVYELTALIANIKEEELVETVDAGRVNRNNSADGHIIAIARLSSEYIETSKGIQASPLPATPGISPYPGAKRVTRNTDGDHMEPEAQEDDAGYATPARGAGGGDAGATSQWILFNDFSISPVDEDEVVTFYGTQKVPCVLHYTKVDDVSEVAATTPMPNMAPSSTEANFRRQIAAPSLSNPRSMTAKTFRPFDMEEDRPYRGMLLGIDAEFVMLHPEEKEIRSDGTEDLKRPARLGLARVSVVRGEGIHAGECCIDDYVRTVEPVHDYLHRFSGLEPGDLEPSTSTHYLISTKTAYMKLRYLIDIGCVFVGHGLKQDFRMLNIVVPAEQVIDTVELFSFKHKRKLSLRFLAAYLLGIDIQKDTHDSIEDARTALALYRAYEKLSAGGEDKFRDTLDEIYRYGYRNQFQVLEAIPRTQSGATDSDTVSE